MLGTFLSFFVSPHIHIIFLGIYIINVWTYIFSYETRITFINTYRVLSPQSQGSYLALSHSVIHACLLAYAMETFTQSQPLLSARYFLSLIMITCPEMQRRRRRGARLVCCCFSVFRVRSKAGGWVALAPSSHPAEAMLLPFSLQKSARSSFQLNRERKGFWVGWWVDWWGFGFCFVVLVTSAVMGICF